MVKQQTAISQHDLVFELLPCYINDTLAVDQNRLAHQHIRECTICQQEVDLLSQSFDVMTSDDVSAYADIEGSLNRVMQRIEQTETDTSSRATLNTDQSGIFKKSIDYLNDLWQRQANTLVGATAGIFALVLVVSLWTAQQQPAEYETLSSPTPDTENVQLDIHFDAAIDLDSIERLIESTSVDFNLYRKTDRRYVVELTDQSQVNAMNQLLQTLNDRHDVIDIKVITK